MMIFLFGTCFSSTLNLKVVEGKDFDIVFQKECEEHIMPILEYASEIYNELSEYYHIKLDKFKIYILDTVDSANAYADPFSNSIIIYLNRNDADSFSNGHEFWLPFVFSHELTHMLVSNKKSVFKYVLNPFGTAISVGIDSAFTPSWYQEGAAILSESKLFDSGRLNDLKFASYIKSDINTREFFGLKYGGSNYSPVFQPSGMNYLYGSSFMKFIYDVYGDEKYVSFISEFGSEYSYNFRNASRKIFDKEWTDLLEEWEEYESVMGKNESFYESEFEQMTFGGYYSGISCSNDVYIYYSDFSDGVFKISRENAYGYRDYWALPFTRNFDFNSKGEIVSVLGVGDGIEKYDTDVYTGKWNGQLKKIKSDLRPLKAKWYGDTALLITSYENGGTSLLIYDISDNSYRKIISGDDSFFINDFDSYQNNIYLSITLHGETSIYDFKTDECNFTKLLPDYGNCFNPSISDGKMLFCSDKDGEYGIYEYNLVSREIIPILSVPYNCADPLFFNGYIYFRNYSGNGFDLCRFDTENADNFKGVTITEFDPAEMKIEDLAGNSDVFEVFEYEDFNLKPETRVFAPFVFPWENQLYGFAGIGGWDDLKNTFWYAYYYNIGDGENFEISLINRAKIPMSFSLIGNPSGAAFVSELEFPFSLRESEKVFNFVPKIHAEVNNIENIKGFENLNLVFELRNTIGNIYNINNDFSVPEFFSIISYGKDISCKGGIGFGLPLSGTGITYVQASSKNAFAAIAAEMWIPINLLKPFGTNDGFFSFNRLTCHVTTKLKNKGFPVSFSMGLALKSTINYWVNSVVNIDLVFDYPNLSPVFSITGVGI